MEGWLLKESYLEIKRFSWNQARGRLGRNSLLQDQTSPCSELREKFKCIDYIGKNER